MFDLTGKVALVTGGNGGIGLAFAKGLLKAGAKVAIWGRNESKNEAALKELAALDGDAAAFVCDVTNTDSVATAFAETMERFGQIDSCFANAGGSGARGLLHELSADDWSAVVDLNLTSVVNTYQPVIKQLIERGRPANWLSLLRLPPIWALGTGPAIAQPRQLYRD